MSGQKLSRPKRRTKTRGGKRVTATSARKPAKIKRLPKNWSPFERGAPRVTIELLLLLVVTFIAFGLFGFVGLAVAVLIVWAIRTLWLRSKLGVK